MTQHTIMIQSDDQKGLVNKITEIIFKKNLNIEKNDEFVDKDNNKFFMRTEVTGE